eukprot:6472088-Amphidinium_carterae.2
MAPKRTGTPPPKRAATSALGDTYKNSTSVSKKPRNAPDLSIEAQVAAAIYDNVRTFTKEQLDGHKVEGAEKGKKVMDPEKRDGF